MLLHLLTLACSLKFYECRAARFSRTLWGCGHSWFYIVSPLFYEEHLDFGLVGHVYRTRVGEVAFLLRGFLSEDVAVESVFPLDLTRSGEGEALLRGRVGFHFRH